MARRGGKRAARGGGRVDTDGLPQHGARVSAGVPVDPSPSFNLYTYSFDDPTSLWVVVNKTRPLEPRDFVPPDFADLSPIPGGTGQQLRAEAADALRALYSAAVAQGLSFSVSTAYRSYGDQVWIHRDWVKKNGRWLADRTSARAGYSEHQTGWAVDIYGGEACRLRACFGSSGIAQWIAAHGWEYGFILRYPEDKTDVTGFNWEPWHLRYMGLILAEQMRSQGTTTLEEMFSLPAAPSYL
jgi:D-alanyl-D-alanine carboxypeptidase